MTFSVCLYQKVLGDFVGINGFIHNSIGAFVLGLHASDIYQQWELKDGEDSANRMGWERKKEVLLM